MMTQSGSLGLTDSGTSGTSFAIMDNYCKLLGIYATDTMHCGAPFTLEASFLQYVLTLETVWADVGGSSFSFAYANGQYLTGNNGCGCDTISNKGNGAVVGCKCAFPVAGEPKKSKREFIAWSVRALQGRSSFSSTYPQIRVCKFSRDFRRTISHVRKRMYLITWGASFSETHLDSNREQSAESCHKACIQHFRIEDLGSYKTILPDP